MLKFLKNKYLIKRILISVLAGAAVIGILVFLFTRATAVNVMKHNRIVLNLQEINKWDVVFDQSLLKLRLGLVTDLQPAEEALKNVQDNFIEGQVALYKKGNKELDTYILTYASFLGQKAKLINELKESLAQKDKDQKKITSLFDQLLAIPSGEKGEMLYNLYLLDHQHEIERSNFYRLLLMGFAGFLVLVVAYAMYRLKKAAVELNKANAALEDYSKNLEVKVEARTAELKAANQLVNAMLNSLGQAFLVFDKSGVCLPTYSKACEDLLEGVPANKHVWDVLHIAPDKTEEFKVWCEVLFGEMIPFDDYSKLGPTTFAHSKGKYVTVEYNAMRNEEDNTLKGVVLVATDKTQERKAMLTAEKEHAHANMLVKFAKNKNRFLNLLREFRKIIEELKRELDSSNSRAPDFKLLFRLMHTMKGGAAAFSIESVREMAHNYEEKLSVLRDASANEQRSSVPDLQKGVAAIDAEVERVIEENREIIGTALSKGNFERRIEVATERLRVFLARLKNVAGTSGLQIEFTNEFIAEPIEKHFVHFNDVIAPVALRLGKKVNPIHFKGGDLRFVEDNYSEFMAAMVHVFRNAVDHGLETPDERADAGKPQAGTISVSFDTDTRRDTSGEKDWLTIIVQDDGRGINPEAIRKKLRSQGNAQAADSENDHQVIQHVFDSGLSTREKVDDISGRGVGMDAVKVAVEKLGGKAEVKSTIGKGTQVVIEVPYKI